MLNHDKVIREMKQTVYDALDAYGMLENEDPAWALFYLGKIEGQISVLANVLDDEEKARMEKALRELERSEPTSPTAGGAS